MESLLEPTPCIFESSRDLADLNKSYELLKSLDHVGNRLRPRDVESLLEHADRHLGVAAAERAEYEQLAVSIDAARRERMDLVGRFKKAQVDLTSARSNAAKRGREKTAAVTKNLESARQHIAHLLNGGSLGEAQIVRRIAIAGALAENGMLPVFTEDYANRNRRVSTNADISGTPMTLDDLQKVGTRLARQFDLEQQRSQVRSQYDALSAQIGSNAALDISLAAEETNAKLTDEVPLKTTTALPGGSL